MFHCLGASTMKKDTGLSIVAVATSPISTGWSLVVVTSLSDGTWII